MTRGRARPRDCHEIPADARAVRDFRRELRAERRETPHRVTDARLVAEHRDRRLGELIEIAIERSAYYRSLVPVRDLYHLGTPEMHGRLPVLGRDILQAHLAELRGAVSGRYLDYHDRTSGTTGRPLRVVRDSRAVLLESLRLAFVIGYYLGSLPPFARDRCAVLYVSHVESSGEHVYRDPMLNDALVVKIRSDRGNVMRRLWRYSIRLNSPLVLTGMPSSLARLALEPGARAGLPPPALVLTSGERLLPATRRLLGRAFGAPVYDTYTMREFGLVGFECRNGGAMHLNADWFVVELGEEDGTPGSAGGGGRILISDLRNRSVPVLRYATDDRGIPAAAGCCELSLPALAEIDGRVPVWFRGADGGWFDPTYIAKEMEHTEALWYRVEQRADGTVDIECCVPDPETRPRILRLAERTRSLVGAASGVRVRFLDPFEIPGDAKAGGLRIGRPTSGEGPE